MIDTLNKTPVLHQSRPLIYRDATKGVLASLVVGLLTSGVLAVLVLLLI